MTEEQWLSCTDPILMLEFLWHSGIAGEKKTQAIRSGLLSPDLAADD